MLAESCTPMGFAPVVVATTTQVVLGSVTVTVTGTTTTAFVQPGANLALIQVEGTAVRWRDDGVPPTPSSGMLIQPTLTPYEYSGNLSKLSFIAVAVSATVDVSLYKLAG